MNDLTINLHHGSPGHPEDFNQLKEALAGKAQTLTKREDHPSVSDSVEVGYSFGALSALRRANRNPEKTKALILLAPYLIPTKDSTIKKLLLGTPLINKFIINKVKEKSIEQMLEKSSSPLAAPEKYKEDAKRYLNSEVLLDSVREKQIDAQEILKEIENLKSHNIKVYLIYGDSDQTMIDTNQLEQIKSLLPIEKEIVLKNQGHALLWTAPKESAKAINDIIQTPKKGYYSGEHIKNNVCSFLEEHIERMPNKNVLSWVSYDNILKFAKGENKELVHDHATFMDLHRAVGVVAGGLKEQGIKKGDRVIVFIPMSFPMYTTMFALQKIGAIAVFLDSWARKDQLDSSAKVVDPVAIVSIEKAFQYLKGIEAIDAIKIKISVGETQSDYTTSFEKLISAKTWADVAAVEKEHTALITFTTGSSGTPKGADRSHRFLASQHYALNRHIPYESSDQDIPAFPIFSLNNIAAGVSTILPAIDVGSPNPLDGKILFKQITDQDVSCTTLSPSLMNALSSFCNQNNLTLPKVRRIITGGAPVSKDDVKNIKRSAPNAEILVLYGSTEVEPMAHISDAQMLKERDNKDPEWVDEGVNVGHFDEGLKVKYINIEKGPIEITSSEDWKKWERPRGEVGEIIVQGEHVCERYYNNEEAFKKSKIKDDKGLIWHRTGDLGFMDDKGDLWLVGRIHNAIQRDGKYLFPVRAEVILKRLPFVKHAAFLGVDHEKLGEATYCVYSLNEEYKDNFNEDEAHSEIMRLMNKNEIPVDKVVSVENIPMDPRHHSKVEYAKLRELL